MPRARWGINAQVIDEFDRESQFTPYTGPTPPSNSVYLFQIKVLKFASGTREKYPQLRIGLELVPRASNSDERKYKGFFVMAFRSITDKSAPFYVPFLDAIGVSATDFIDRTITDEEGNIKKIGRWRNDGKQTILAQLRDSQDNNGNVRKDVGWMGAPTDDEMNEIDEEEEYDEEEQEEEEEEVEEAPRRSRPAKARPTQRRRNPARRTRDEEDDPF